MFPSQLFLTHETQTVQKHTRSSWQTAIGYTLKQSIVGWLYGIKYDIIYVFKLKFANFAGLNLMISSTHRDIFWILENHIPMWFDTKQDFDWCQSNKIQNWFICAFLCFWQAHDIYCKVKEAV